MSALVFTSFFVDWCQKHEVHIIADKLRRLKFHIPRLSATTAAVMRRDRRTQGESGASKHARHNTL